MKCPSCHTVASEDSQFCSKCGVSLKGQAQTRTIQGPATVFKKGQLIAGKYRVIQKIGEGGMGVVYKAQDTKLDRPVALKFIPPDVAEDAEVRERFVREAKAAAALSHNHICTVYEIGEDENQYFIAMECITGEGLKEKIRRGPLSQAEALDITIQVAEGLDEAHRKGIIHRDIKPSNVMVTENGQSKVMDFGLAKVFGASFITKEARTMGTVAYMSPEQAQGQDVDQRTDIWSLGVVLYEMLTGRLPFKGEYDQSIIHSILNDEPEPLTKTVSMTPKALESVIFTALAKDPAHRYQSMEEMLKDLNAVAQGLKPLKAKHGLFRSRVLGVRMPVFFMGLAVLAVAIALVTVKFIVPVPHAEVFDSVAILPVINESGDPEKEYFADSLTRQLNTDLYKVAALTVPPAESIMAFKGSNKPPKKIAEELKVKALVHVSWLQVGSRHRMIYTLSDPFRDRIISAGTLEREGEDILFLQSELARAIVSAVKVVVARAEQTLLAGGSKVNPKAFDLCMRGHNSRNKYNLTEALDYFDRAIKADPHFALAYAYRGNVYWELGVNGPDAKETLRKAREDLQKALELDDNLAFAHTNMAWLLSIMDWDFAGAEREFKRSLDLEPGNNDVVNSYGQFLSRIGRFKESIKLFAGVQGSTPPELAGSLACPYLFDDRLDEGLQIAEKAYQENPSDLNKMWLSTAYILKGNYDQALHLSKEYSATPALYELSLLDEAIIYARLGKREEALAAAEIVRSRYAEKNIDSAYDLSTIYAELGDKDKAIDLLNEAYRNHSAILINLKTCPFLRNLHGDPRFDELIRKIGFPEVPADSLK